MAGINGEAIKNAMAEKHLSYAGLSKLCGIPKSTLQRHVAGKSKNINLDEVKKIADSLCIPASLLIFMGENTSMLDIVAADNGYSEAFDLLQKAKQARPDDGDELDEVSEELVGLLMKLTPQEAEKTAAYIQGLLAAREE